MALTDWCAQGVCYSNCNCDYGCPCQFMSRPTQGYCHGFLCSEIESGHFGDVSLDGLRFLMVINWPGAVHEGNGRMQVVIDEAADDRQRAALAAITHGEETEPGSGILSIYAMTAPNFSETLFRPIRFEHDVKAGRVRLEVPELFQSHSEPIRNPVSGAPHWAYVQLPEGMEYHEALYLNGTTRSETEIPLSYQDSHAHIGRFSWGTRGWVE